MNLPLWVQIFYNFLVDEWCSLWVAAFGSDLISPSDHFILRMKTKERGKSFPWGQTVPLNLHLTFTEAIRTHEWPLLRVFVPIVPGKDRLAQRFSFSPVCGLRLNREEMPWKYFKKLLLIRLHLISSTHEKGRACCESLRGPITEAFGAADISWCGLWAKWLPTQRLLFTADHSSARHFQTASFH